MVEFLLGQVWWEIACFQNGVRIGGSPFEFGYFWYEWKNARFTQKE